MDKKKVLILISSLFLLILIIIFITIGIINTTNNSKNKNDNNHINTSQIQGGTNYNHNDTQSEYAKMIEKAKEQEQLAKLQKNEKKTKEEKEGKKEQEENNETTRKIKENGVTYITHDSGIKIPEGVAGTKPVKSKRLPDSDAYKYKNEKPFYAKYIREVPESTLKRKTQETKILHKYLRGNDLIITSIDVSTKGNRAAIAYKKNKNGGIETALVSILNQAGTAKKEHLNNLHYTVNFDVDYIDNDTTNCYKIVKALGMPIKESEFENLYRKYKYGKLTDDDYKKPYSIGFNEIEVVVEW